LTGKLCDEAARRGTNGKQARALTATRPPVPAIIPGIRFHRPAGSFQNKNRTERDKPQGHGWIRRCDQKITRSRFAERRAAADETLRRRFSRTKLARILKCVAPINIVRRRCDRAGAEMTLSFQRIFLN